MAYHEDDSRAFDRSPRRSRREGDAYSAARERIDSPPRLGRAALHPCPELDCIRHRFPPGTLAAVERRAVSIGVSAEQVLILAGLISEDAYLKHLAMWLRLSFEPLDDLPRDASPVSDEVLIEAAATGILPLVQDRRLIWIVAPRGLAARRLIALLRARSDLRARLRITSPGRLRQFMNRHGADALGRHAADRLQTREPEFSAAPRPWRPERATVALAVVCLAATIAAPGAALGAVALTMTAVFLGWAGLRGWAVCRAAPARPSPVRISDDLLPVYTVIVALYNEARVLPDLVAALSALDYPPEKLDLKLVLEADDFATRMAAAMMNLDRTFEIVVAPRAGPRNKPKALNAALPFARGAYTAVYDAEDRPDPDQLRCALKAFLSEDDGLACVQAALTIDNTADNVLTRLFTAEYAAQFDVLLPGLVALRLPIPLGGSSNHFQTAVLQAAGGWDPYNVTEDADLGVRLARRGYRTSSISSTTREEAPARLKPWIRQRTRWFKGWMQTYCVHMRRPSGLVRDLGWPGFLAFQLILGGTTLAALVQPLLLGLIAAAWFAEVPMLTPGASLVSAAIVGLHGAALVGGYTASCVLAVMGLKRRGLLAEAWVLLLLPLHWMLLSVAAWRALYQFVFDRYRWEKTAHGLARTSRASPRPPARRNAR